MKKIRKISALTLLISALLAPQTMAQSQTEKASPALPWDLLDSSNPDKPFPDFSYYWHDNKTIVIQYHKGGLIRLERHRINKAKARGIKIVLSDYTLSSATLWLSYPSSKLCIDPSAEFWFHQVNVISNFGSQRKSSAGTKAYFNSLPQKVRAYIKTQHVPAWKQPDPETNLPWVDWIRVSGAKAIELGWARACPKEYLPSGFKRFFGGSVNDQNKPGKSTF